MTPPSGLEPGGRVNHGAEDRAGRDGQADADGDDDRGVAEGEKEPGAEGPLPVGHQLAGGVVDRRDVVGVEGVPGAEGPGGERHAQPEAQALELEMVRGDREHEDAPATDVQDQDHAGPSR